MPIRFAATLPHGTVLLPPVVVKTKPPSHLSLKLSPTACCTGLIR